MKKILIVNNNLDMGGIQKSLLNLLKEMHRDYNITLLLFSKSGVLLKDVPENIKIITPNKCYKMLGLTRDELKKYPILFIAKFLLIKYTCLFSRRNAMKLLGLFQKKINGYDIAISYSHLSHHKYFGNGCGEFVLDKVNCKTKICLIHCDYLGSGYMTKTNNANYSKFNMIACCSNSVKERFIQGSKLHSTKVYTLENFYDLDIVKLANDEPYVYDDNYINMVTVARLSPEKGIDKAIDALFDSGRKDIRYYVIGSGPQKEVLQGKIDKYQMENQIILLGEKQNPYRYMKNADYLLVPSLHEAAPMVFDEAMILGLPIISTNTTSAKEKLNNYPGIVIDDIDDMNEVIKETKKIKNANEIIKNNKIQKEQFTELIKANS